jgi:N-methylhydantoinase A
LARHAVGQLAERLRLSPEKTAAGMLRISEAKITGAIREISVERGFHPKDFALLSFGGGGGFVATGVARELGVPAVIIPPGPANFSALGMLMVDVVHDFAQTHITELHDADRVMLSRIYADLIQQGRDALTRDGFQPKDCVFLCSAELRYQGQEHTVNVPLEAQDFAASDLERIATDFNTAHVTQYGHRMDDPVELVTARVSAVGLLPSPLLPTIATGTGKVEGALKGKRAVYQPLRDTYTNYAVYERGRLLHGDRVEGPAIIEEPSSTTILHAGDTLWVGKFGELNVTVGK